MCLFVIRKVSQRKTLSGQRKTLSSQRKIHCGQRKTLSSQFQSKKNLTWFSGKCFPKKFRGKHVPEVVKNLEMSLFADYIKFDPQTFDRYIYFVFNIYFQFHLLKFYFYINFGPYFYNCYLFFSYHFFIENFYLSDLVLILLIVTYFI